MENTLAEAGKASAEKPTSISKNQQMTANGIATVTPSGGDEKLTKTGSVKKRRPSRPTKTKITPNGEHMFVLQIENTSVQKTSHRSFRALLNSLRGSEKSSAKSSYDFIEVDETSLKVYKKKGSKEKLCQELDLKKVLAFNSYNLIHDNSSMMPDFTFRGRSWQLTLYSKDGTFWQITCDGDSIKKMESEIRKRMNRIKKAKLGISDELYDIAFTGAVDEVEILDDFDKDPELSRNIIGVKQFMLKATGNLYKIVIRDLPESGIAPTLDEPVIITKNQVYSRGYDKTQISFKLLANSVLGSASFMVTCTSPNIIDHVMRPFLEKENRGITTSFSGSVMSSRGSRLNADHERALRAREYHRTHAGSLPQYIEFRQQQERSVANSLEASAKSMSSPEAISLNDSGVPQST